MAVFTSKVHDNYNASNHMEFVVDQDSDVEFLPGLETCAPGSKATSIESGTVFYLTTFGFWTANSQALVTEDLNVSEPGTYIADEGKAFNPVIVSSRTWDIHYVVNWSGDKSGRQNISAYDTNYYRVSDRIPQSGELTAGDMMGKLITDDTAIDFSLVVGIEDEDGYTIVNPSDDSVVGIVNKTAGVPGIYCADPAVMSQVLGINIVSIELSWQKTGRIEIVDEGAVIANDNPLTLDLSWAPEPQSNPNYVETIMGTLENPWGDVDVDAVASQCLTDDATVYLFADATALGMQEIELALQRGGINQMGVPFGAIEFRSGDDPGFNGVLVVFERSTGDVSFAMAEVAGVISGLLPYATQIPTTLTIIHHPLPDTP